MWSCPGCTFENHPAIVSCEMCGTKRPSKNSIAGSGRHQDRADGRGRAAGSRMDREAGAGRGGGGRGRGTSRGNRGRAGSKSTQQQSQPQQFQPQRRQPHQKQKTSKQPQRQQRNQSPSQQQALAVEHSQELQQKRVAALALLGGGTSLTDDKGQTNSTEKPPKVSGHNRSKERVDGCTLGSASGSKRKQNKQKASKQEPHRASDSVSVPSAKDQHQKRTGAESSKKNKNKNKNKNTLSLSSQLSKASGTTQPREKGAQASAKQWPTAPPLRTDGQVTVLHVAEKPSIAQALANALCGNKRPEQRNGPTPVHEFTSVPFPIPGSGSSVRCKHRVTSGAFHHTLGLSRFCASRIELIRTRLLEL